MEYFQSGLFKRVYNEQGLRGLKYKIRSRGLRRTWGFSMDSYLDENSEENAQDILADIIAVGSGGKAAADNNMEVNLKEYLRYYFIYKISDDSIALAKIWNIARQCVFEGGPSVLEARAFLYNQVPLAIADSLEFYDISSIDTCRHFEGSSKMSLNDQKIETHIQISEPILNYKIIPNLFNGNRTGQLALGQKEEGRVEIYDMRGTLFVFSNLFEGINTLNLNSLPKGVFIYKVFVNGEVKINDKLVVIE